MDDGCVGLGILVRRRMLVILAIFVDDMSRRLKLSRSCI